MQTNLRSKISYFAAIASLALVFIPALVGNLYSQDETIRVETDLITIPTLVLDRNGRYVTDLNRADFRVFEDGIEQKMTLFESVEQPFAVFLLLDRSGSMANHFTELEKASNAFVAQLRPDDNLFVATFANDVVTLISGVKAKNIKKDIKIRSRLGDNDTRIYDAVDHALKKLKKIKGRKAIVLFSDGAGSGLYASRKDNIQKAEENEALIYTIQFNTFKNIRPYNVKLFLKGIEDAGSYMWALPRITGGRDFQIETIADLAGTFRMIVEELGKQYSLGYYPARPGKPGERRQINVKVNRPDVAVRSRNEVVFGALSRKK